MRRPKILVADDSSIDADRVRSVLCELPGASVTIVEDGAAAVREAKHTRFDLLLVDYEMPGLNGLQVVRVLRGSWSRLELPILMLTVRDDVHTKALAFRQGASDYVTKPVQPEELLARVQAHLDLRLAVQENLEARLRMLEASKLETLGRLAAGVAHELNTPAQFTSDNIVFLERVLGAAAELLERTRHEAAQTQQAWSEAFLGGWEARQLSYLLGEAPKALEESRAGVMRMAKVVRELQEFAGVPDENWDLADVNRALSNTAHVSRQLWQSLATVSFRLDPELPQVTCDATALRQAFFNILMTLVENIERASSAPRQLAEIDIETRHGAALVEVRFHARGPGLSRGVAGAFEQLPERDVLGMASVHQLALAHSVVVTQHRGELLLEPAPEREVTVLVRLPEVPPSTTHARRVPGIPFDHG